VFRRLLSNPAIKNTFAADRALSSDPVVKENTGVIVTPFWTRKFLTGTAILSPSTWEEIKMLTLLSPRREFVIGWVVGIDVVGNDVGKGVPGESLKNHDFFHKYFVLED